ncbi:hypothetical protein SLA2020_258560 [Shorea laevis]
MFQVIKSSFEENRFAIKSMPFVDWPYSDYEILQPVKKTDCRRSCLLDCTSAIAIQEELELNNGIGHCRKKKLPLSNGWIDKSKINRRLLIKVLKSSDNLR